MAENRETETFALGLIVAAIVYFIFRRQLDRVLNVGGGMGGGARTTSGGAGGSGGCGCGGGCGSEAAKLPTNPGISIGNQSYNAGQAAFESSSVAATSYPKFFGIPA